MFNVKTFLILLFALLLTGCATTKGDWEKANRLNTAEAYEEFLRKHPESEFTEEAKKRIPAWICFHSGKRIVHVFVKWAPPGSAVGDGEGADACVRKYRGVFMRAGGVDRCVMSAEMCDRATAIGGVDR